MLMWIMYNLKAKHHLTWIMYNFKAKREREESERDKEIEQRV